MSLTVKHKILLAGLLWSVITLAFGSYIYLCMERQNEIQAQLELSKQVTQKFSNLLTIMVDMETGIRGYLLSGEDAYLEPFNAAEGLFDQEAKDLALLIKGDAPLSAELDKMVTSKKAWIEGPAVEDMMQRKKFTRGMIDFNAFVSAFKASKGKTLTDAIREAVKNARAITAQTSERLEREQSERTQFAKRSASWGILFAVLVGLALLTITVIRLNKQIRLVVANLLEQASSLRELSTRLNQSSSSLSDCNESTAKALQQTSTAVTQIASMTSSNAELAHKAQSSADTCGVSAEQGVTAVSRMIETMTLTAEGTHEMRKQVELSHQKLNQIVNRIQEISQKTQVIHEIVFQTKLLSFNASVEAARAGEHGKGFAIVAEEVGNLASMSGKAAKEISDLLAANQNVINQTIGETTETLESLVAKIEDRVAEATHRSQECGTAFEEIRTKIASIQAMAREISAGSGEQSRGVTEVSNSMQQIDASGKANASMAEQAQDFASTLARSSEKLNEKVEGLYYLFERKAS